MKGRRLDRFAPGQGKVVGFSGHGDKPSFYTKCGGFLDCLRNYKFHEETWLNGAG